jgi:hypothetical protein
LTSNLGILLVFFVPVAQFRPNLAGAQSRSEALLVLCSHESDKSDRISGDPSSRISFIPNAPLALSVTVFAVFLNHTSPRRTPI